MTASTEVEDNDIEEDLEQDDLEDTDEHQTDGADEAGEQQPQKKGVRAKVKVTTEERDVLREQLASARGAILQQVCEEIGLTVEAATANGIRAEDHLDENGAVDVPSLVEAGESKRLELGESVTRRPRPNPLAGRGNKPPAKTQPTFGELLKEHTKNARQPG